jgi:hypothetical protein
MASGKIGYTLSTRFLKNYERKPNPNKKENVLCLFGKSISSICMVL